MRCHCHSKILKKKHIRPNSDHFPMLKNESNGKRTKKSKSPPSRHTIQFSNEFLLIIFRSPPRQGAIASQLEVRMTTPLVAYQECVATPWGLKVKSVGWSGGLLVGRFHGGTEWTNWTKTHMWYEIELCKITYTSVSSLILNKWWFVMHLFVMHLHDSRSVSQSGQQGVYII